MSLLREIEGGMAYGRADGTIAPALVWAHRAAVHAVAAAR